MAPKAEPMIKKVQHFFDATFHPQFHGLGGYILGIGLVSGAWAWWARSWVLGVISLGVMAGFAWFTRLASDLLEYNDRQHLKDGGRYSTEPFDHHASPNLDSDFGTARATLSSDDSEGGIQRVNIDGTPMVGGVDIDILGRGYGDVSDSMADTFAGDAGMDISGGFDGTSGHTGMST